jgi:hypothetical protein
MMTPSETINIRYYQPDDIVCVFSKGRPVICSVIAKKNKNEQAGFQLKILDVDIVSVLGQDTIWVPTEMVEPVGEA